MGEKFLKQLKLIFATSPRLQALEAKFARSLDLMRKTAAIFLVISLVGQMFSFATPLFSAGSREYDENGIIWGGAYSKSELLSKIKNGDGKHTDIKQIFNTIGIYESDINRAETVDGVVYKNGSVEVAGKKVAAGVIVAGRKNLAGSTADPNLPIYWRSPSTSFNSESVSAFVYLHNGQFVWAILKSCGNPVVKEIRIKPQLTVNKEVKKEGDSDWQKTIEAKPGDTLAYLISWTNPSKITALETYVRDSLPPYVSPVPGSAKLYDSAHPNGVSVDVNALVKGGLSVGNTLPDNKPHYIRFQAKVASNLPAGTHTLINVGAVRAYSVPEVSSEAKTIVKITVQVQEGKIAGIKFNDVNGDGKKDNGEAGLSGVTIRVLSGGRVLKTTTTDQNGAYSFDHLAPGNYTVEEIVPAGWQNTTPVSVNVKVESNKTTVVNFGNKKIVLVPQKAQIHGLKFHDLNNNAKRDSNEPGVLGVKINLYKVKETLGVVTEKILIATTTTDKVGQFHFLDLEPGTYIVEEVVPEGWIATTEPSVKVVLKEGDSGVVEFGNFKKEIVPPSPTKPVPKLPQTGLPAPSFLPFFLILSSAYLYLRERFLLKLTLLQV